MRDYQSEFKNRVEFIRNLLIKSGSKGIVYGNSGGKDSALVGILCKAACENTLGLIMPCSSKRNFEEDTVDAQTIAGQFGIETRTIDLTPVKDTELAQLSLISNLTPATTANIAPRLRMTTLYAIAASESRLVAGTGNRSEGYVGYFTKWGDGACDFNPIADLTVTEIYEFLHYLNAPTPIIQKAPSAGLFEGQTDEGEMGFAYKDLDNYLLTGKGEPRIIEAIEHMHNTSSHKREPVKTYNKD